MPIPKSITDDQIEQTIKEWESDGFTFFGFSVLPDDEDSPCSCPNCDDHGYYCGLWTKQVEGVDSWEEPTNSINRCYECGYQWAEAEGVIVQQSPQAGQA